MRRINTDDIRQIARNVVYDYNSHLAEVLEKGADEIDRLHEALKDALEYVQKQEPSTAEDILIRALGGNPDE